MFERSPRSDSGRVCSPRGWSGRQAQQVSPSVSDRTARPGPSLLGEATAAAATAISSMGLSIALATLIFAGPLQDGLARATTNFLLAGAVGALVVGIRGGFKPTISVLQDGPAIVIVTVAAGLGKTAGEPTLDVFALLALSTLLTGVAMLAVGYFGVGEVARFFPTTVIAGFIAGTGWLLAKGGFDVMVDRALELDDLSVLLEPDVAKYWLPGAALGVLIQVLASFRRVPAGALSAVVIGAALVFFAAVFGISSIDAAEEANWFIGPFPAGADPQPLTPSELADVEWGEVLGRPGGIIAAVAVSLVAVLLNLSGLETLTRDRVDTKRELGLAGITNIIVSPLAPVPGFHGLGDTALARQMGAHSAAAPIAVAALSVGTAFFGSRIVGLTPRIIVGGLLVAVGLALLISWLQSMRSTSSRIERVLSALIVLSIAAIGILEGILFGLIAACLIFVARYSRIDPVKLEATAADLPSRVVRSPSEREILTEHADTIAVYQLTGYQFFGSFASVVERVRKRAETAAPSPTSIILDFRHVTGVDSSAFTLLDQIARDLAEANVQLILSDLDPELTRNFHLDTATMVGGLDFAVEHAENSLLAAAGDGDPPLLEPFADLSSALVEQLTRRTIAPGETLIAQGSDDVAMYLVLSGDLVVTRHHGDGSLHRLRRIGSGAVVGENALLTGTPRSASISAMSSSEVYEVTAEDYERLRRLAPKLALELQDHVLAELATRSVSLSEHLTRALR